MNERPPHVTNLLHLLSPSDLEWGEAQLTSEDGDSIVVSPPLWDAIQQLVECSRHGMNAWVVPIDERLDVDRAARMFAMSGDELRKLLVDAKASLIPDALGETALTEDVVAVTNRERARRHAAWIDYMEASEDLREDLGD